MLQLAELLFPGSIRFVQIKPKITTFKKNPVHVEDNNPDALTKMLGVICSRDRKNLERDQYGKDKW